ncbi:MFS transporter [Microvirga guangxiensis]|uniref:Predicted arabinose efflux permease, MFS family n=1 Tax=Microvirga guangxiensis TaxID=549386 RepID=A0A1G5KRJ6_9HYPH|nr:MFS transporter [Microvirga guangxiensis]SCZ02738.1 Predicted arabinose efflux permease, MFS family [Microvirga guangxiensis]
MDSAVKTAPTRQETAVFLIAALAAIYAISQFLRNSIGVIANDLARELSLSATQTGLLSSAFFFAFAAVQIPVGIAIDRYGPRNTMLVTAALTVVSTILFALAPSASALIAARALMGLGCSTFLMAPLVIFARRFPPVRFAGHASMHMGLANIGTLSATAPLAVSAAYLGWRTSFLAVAGLTAVIALVLVWAVPKDEPKTEGRENLREAFRGVARAIKVRSFWPVFFVHLTTYGCFASVVGLWGGPWLTDVHGADLESRGNILLIGAGSQIAGLLTWGVLDRYWGSYKRLVLLAGSATALLLIGLVVLPLGLTSATIWFGLFGFCVAYTPVLMAHGKTLFPPEIMGRGITLMNIGTMGGAFLSQSVTGMLIDLVGRSEAGGYSPEGYRLVFATLAAWLLLSLCFYLRAIDSHPARYASKA